MTNTPISVTIAVPSGQVVIANHLQPYAGDMMDTYTSISTIEGITRETQSFADHGILCWYTEDRCCYPSLIDSNQLQIGYHQPNPRAEHTSPDRSRTVCVMDSALFIDRGGDVFDPNIIILSLTPGYYTTDILYDYDISPNHITLQHSDDITTPISYPQPWDNTRFTTSHVVAYLENMRCLPNTYEEIQSNPINILMQHLTSYGMGIKWSRGHINSRRGITATTGYILDNTPTQDIPWNDIPLLNTDKATIFDIDTQYSPINHFPADTDPYWLAIILLINRYIQEHPFTVNMQRLIIKSKVTSYDELPPTAIQQLQQLQQTQRNTNAIIAQRAWILFHRQYPHLNIQDIFADIQQYWPRLFPSHA